MEPLAKFQSTEPVPMWFWRQRGVYYPFSNSDMIEKAYQKYRKIGGTPHANVGFTVVNFGRMISFFRGSTRNERVILRGTWFWKDDEDRVIPYEKEIAERLELAVQSGIFNRVEVQSKPFRFVVFEGNTFQQYRYTKSAVREGKGVIRGHEGQMMKDGVIVSVAKAEHRPTFRRTETMRPIDQDLLYLRKFQGHDLNRDNPHLAQGSYGIVYTGKVHDIPQKVVIKDIMLRDKVKTKAEWISELTTMSKAPSPYIVKVHGYSFNDTVLTIVMEYLEQGDLYTLLHKNKECYTPMMRLDFALQISIGLQYLHRSNVLHRDIKSMNILLSKDHICKITDFGLSKILTEGQMFHTANAGTLLWMAPEVSGGVYTYSADVYSLGLVIYELLEERLPDWDKASNKVIIPTNYFSKAIVCGCLETDVRKRASLDSLIKKLSDMAVAVTRKMEAMEKLQLLKASSSPVIHREESKRPQKKKDKGKEREDEEDNRQQLVGGGGEDTVVIENQLWWCCNNVTAEDEEEVYEIWNQLFPYTDDDRPTLADMLKQQLVGYSPSPSPSPSLPSSAYSDYPPQSGSFLLN